MKFYLTKFKANYELNELHSYELTFKDVNNNYCEVELFSDGSYSVKTYDEVEGSFLRDIINFMDSDKSYITINLKGEHVYASNQ